MPHGDADDGRSLGGCETLPGDEEQQLALDCGQFGEFAVDQRSGRHGVESLVHRLPRVARRLLLRGRRAGIAGDPLPVAGQHVACHTEEPGPGRSAGSVEGVPVGEGLQPHFRQQIVGGGRCSSCEIAVQRDGMPGNQRFECRRFRGGTREQFLVRNGIGIHEPPVLDRPDGGLTPTCTWRGKAFARDSRQGAS